MRHTPLGGALSSLAAGKDDEARHALSRMKDESVMARALALALSSGSLANAYDAPSAFEAFIRSRGNIALYGAVSSTLARLYDHYRPHRLLDIGTGDGMALLPAIAEATHVPREIDVIEPSEQMFEKLIGSLSVHAGYTQGFEAFAEDLAQKNHWDMAQSSFALQSIPPSARTKALRRLARHVDRLVVIEFDVPDLPLGSRDLHESLATRYECAASEQEENADLVASGFLVPMLLGQLRAATPSNWEQPASAWLDELTSAGFRAVKVEHVHDYSWASAMCLVADA
ncbi:MAG TPA: methyltransferase domain-containing protein [Luteibacter sp.]|uniref:methyltransferase domain-containing protein n=1 Tax=Luteibacter sp. TaxID=1886636 RepID=UPI002C5AC38F|nr:methyltransferase domain-containing protein [Luteibacter sp.]HVI54526.1 methyltransferase domain-containing protein [Luteibacter sp.]